MNSWPQDVLLIHYTELAENAEQRLHLLGLIGVLLNQKPGVYDAASLNLQQDDWQRLFVWLEQSNAAYFWGCEGKFIRVVHTCEKHILVGTGQLIKDMTGVKNQPSLQAILDTVWEIAQGYVETEIYSESGQS